MPAHFDHEKLRVYQESIIFVAWCEQMIQSCEGKAAVKDQLDRASTSIPLNIAEGNGKYPGKDRCRFLEIARSSALESAACLDVLVVKQRFTAQEVGPGKSRLHGIVSILGGLINNVSERISEETAGYGSDVE